ncbi:Hpt domain-containing protein [Hugenholtzia roseola]|uniref:Hpt domain-containing protein n=1 Tax=Hugenholtzia roseola TaxID=1002 RepID=UPI00040061FF|nr:Hpt domain-containing protein [Hugenholtzia roseola]
MQDSNSNIKFDLNLLKKQALDKRLQVLVLDAKGFVVQSCESLFSLLPTEEAGRERAQAASLQVSLFELFKPLAKFKPLFLEGNQPTLFIEKIALAPPLAQQAEGEVSSTWFDVFFERKEDKWLVFLYHKNQEYELFLKQKKKNEAALLELSNDYLTLKHQYQQLEQTHQDLLRRQQEAFQAQIQQWFHLPLAALQQLILLPLQEKGLRLKEALESALKHVELLEDYALHSRKEGEKVFNLPLFLEEIEKAFWHIEFLQGGKIEIKQKDLPPLSLLPAFWQVDSLALAKAVFMLVRWVRVRFLLQKTYLSIKIHKTGFALWIENAGKNQEQSPFLPFSETFQDLHFQDIESIPEFRMMQKWAAAARATVVGKVGLEKVCVEVQVQVQPALQETEPQGFDCLALIYTEDPTESWALQTFCSQNHIPWQRVIPTEATAFEVEAAFSNNKTKIFFVSPKSIARLSELERWKLCLEKGKGILILPALSLEWQKWAIEQGLEYLVKPFEPTALAQKIKHLLSKPLKKVYQEQIDLTTIYEIVDGQVEMVQTMLMILAKNLQEYPEQMHQRFLNGDLAGLRQLAHKFKSCTAYTGLSQFNQTLSDIETSAETGLSLNQIETLVSFIAEASIEVEKQVQQKMTEILDYQ